MNDFDGVDPETFRKIIRLLGNGRSLQAATEITGAPYGQVTAIARAHGYPDTRKLRDAYAALEVAATAELVAAALPDESAGAAAAGPRASDNVPCVPDSDKCDYTDPHTHGPMCGWECACGLGDKKISVEFDPEPGVSESAVIPDGIYDLLVEALGLGLSAEVDELNAAITSLAAKVRDARELAEALEAVKAAEARVEAIRARNGGSPIGRRIGAGHVKPGDVLDITYRATVLEVGDECDITTDDHRRNHNLHAYNATAVLVDRPAPGPVAKPPAPIPTEHVHGTVVDVPAAVVTGDVLAPGYTVVDDVENGGVVALGPLPPLAGEDDPDAAGFEVFDGTRRCDHCGSSFKPRRKDQRFDSKQCRERWFNANAKAAK